MTKIPHDNREKHESCEVRRVRRDDACDRGPKDLPNSDLFGALLRNVGRQPEQAKAGYDDCQPGSRASSTSTTYT